MFSVAHVVENACVYSAAISHARPAGAARALLHLVLAGVGVGRQMADVGDVHHVPDAIAVPSQHALQHVLEQERAVVADVLVVVDGRAARVEADRALRRERREFAQAARVSCRRAAAASRAGSVTTSRTMMKSSMTKPSPIGKSPRARIANPHRSYARIAQRVAAIDVERDGCASPPLLRARRRARSARARCPSP